MDLTTTARVTALMGSAFKHDGKAEAQIARIVTLYSEAFKTYLDRETLAAAQTEYLSLGYGQQAVELKAFPVTSVTSVYNDTSREWATGEIAATAYYLDTATGLMVIDGVTLIHGPGVLRVIYAGGMAADVDAFIAAFPDIADACDMQVIAHYQRRNQLSAQGVSLGGGNVSYTGPIKLLPEVRAILAKHRRWPIG